MVRPFSEEIRQQWKDNILRQVQSKLSIASWCRQNGIAIHSFYYWQKKLFPKTAIDRSAFTEALEEINGSTGEIILEYQGYKIYLNENFNPSVLKKCLEILMQC